MPIAKSRMPFIHGEYSPNVASINLLYCGSWKKGYFKNPLMLPLHATYASANAPTTYRSNPKAIGYMDRKELGLVNKS